MRLTAGCVSRPNSWVLSNVATTIAKWSAGVAVHFALEQCHDLLDNHVAGIHFYTLNKSDATRTIFDSLGLPRRSADQVPIA